MVGVGEGGGLVLGAGAHDEGHVLVRGFLRRKGRRSRWRPTALRVRGFVWMDGWMCCSNEWVDLKGGAIRLW